MNDNIPPFEPRITETLGLGTFYEDGRVFGEIDIYDKSLVISGWSSAFEGKGHTLQALEWFRTQGYEITANGIGETIKDPSYAYWVHLYKKGYVDYLTDDASFQIDTSIYRREDNIIV